MPSLTRKIYWFLIGSRDVASSRIHGYHVHEYLRKHGWESQLVVTPLHWLQDTPLSAADIRRSGLIRSGDVVVFQKLCGPITASVMKLLQDKHVNTVLIDSDYPLKVHEAQLATVTVCPSEYLAQAYRQEGIANVLVIPDAYESTFSPALRQNNRKLRCVWFGDMDPIKEIEVRWLKKLLSKHFPNVELVVISNHEIADIKWDTSKSWDVIKDCDVALITGSDYFWMKAKSSNRVTQAMALGLPVIAYPLPAYQAIIRHGRNGMLSTTDEEWIRALAAMSSPDVRERIARTGHRYARRYFSIEKIGEQWAKMFTELGTAQPAPQSVVHKMLRDLRLRSLRFKAYRGMAASFRPMNRLQRSYIFQGWKEWLQ